MAPKYMKRYSTLFIIRKMQMKTTLRKNYVVYLVSWARAKSLTALSVWRGCGETSSHILVTKKKKNTKEKEKPMVGNLVTSSKITRHTCLPQ
jgi:hypothetical protein